MIGPQSTGNPGFVYFIRANGDGPVKIGFTAHHPRKRMAKIQSDCPWPVEMLGAIKGTIEQERSFHLKLCEFKVQGEWFSPEPIVLQAVQDALRVGERVPDKKPWGPRHTHPLCLWLSRNQIRAMHFAKIIGVTPGAISNMFIDGKWISRELARKIYDATNGEVTPTDIMLWDPPAEREAA